MALFKLKGFFFQKKNLRNHRTEKNNNCEKFKTETEKQQKVRRKQKTNYEKYENNTTRL